MNRAKLISSVSPRSLTTHTRRNPGALGYLIAIAAAGLPLSLGTSCRTTRGATGDLPWQSKFKPCIFALLALLLIMPPGQAAVVLDGQTRVVGACRNERCDSLGIVENSSPFTSEFNESVSSFGFQAQQMTVVNVIPGSGILTGASGSGSIVDAVVAGNLPIVDSRLIMLFTVSDNPASVSLQVETTGASPGAGAVEGFGLLRLDPFEVLLNPTGPFSDTFESELDVGSYRFEIFARGTGMGAERRSWEFDLFFGSRWVNPVDGTYSDGAKWTGGRAPAEADTAIFDQPGTYTVEFDGNVTNQAMQVKGAGVDVMLDLNGFQYHADELKVSDGAAVTFDGADGGPVSASAAGVAAAASDVPPIEPLALVPIVSVIDARGIVNIPAKSNRYLIDVGGNLDVKSPSGKVEIDELLTVARNGSGTLRVSDGGRLIAVEVVLGENAGSSGTATVQGSGSQLAVDGTLFVGLQGRGELNIRNRAKAAVGLIKVGDSTSGFGTVNVEGQGSSLEAIRLEFGFLGKAILNVKDTAGVEVDEFLIRGQNAVDDSDGANIRDFGNVHVTNQLTIGDGGRMIVGNNGLVENDSLDSGLNPGTVIVSTGKLIIRSGGAFHEHHSLAVNGQLRINPTASAASIGEIPVTRSGVLTITNGGELSGNGVIRSDGVVDFGGVHNFTGQVLPGSSPGTLTIEGNYEQTGGLLGIEIAGTALGEFDVLKVTGDVSLDGDLLLQFIDGFAPRQGDEFMFLDVDGTLIGEFANVQVRGLMPGFQFELRPDVDGLAMVALNDGVSVPEPASVAMFFVGMLVSLIRPRCSHRAGQAR
jgi:T5SS/PEP-CTERM-associated repeat protein